MKKKNKQKFLNLVGVAIFILVVAVLAIGSLKTNSTISGNAVTKICKTYCAVRTSLGICVSLAKLYYDCNGKCVATSPQDCTTPTTNCKYSEQTCKTNKDCCSGLSCVGGKCNAQCKSSQKIGDVDGDGDIDTSDANLVADIYVGNIPPPSNICCADINKDGKIDIKDSLKIARIVRGLDKSLGVCCMIPPIINSLVVVVDFQDKKLEDYAGAGVNNVSDIQNILKKMTSHWEWMSVGAETMSWKIIRITLPKKFTKNAYLGWNQFRDEIVILAKQKIDAKLYDSNKDGVIDNIFAIVSSGKNDVTTGYGYIFGGASQNEGARIFMDPQGSLSVRDEVYGNFNHEIGHGIGLININGLPDIYGDYDTLGYLSLMSDSWPLPAFGFSAYERYRLGWINSKIVTTTQKNLSLLPAEENLQAVKIFTDNPKEYFLVEYRKRPKSGFGSATAINFNGLIIYHVKEEQSDAGTGTNQGGFPPLLYVEPADGKNIFPSSPEENDFWFPENKDSIGVFSAKRYNSDKIIFRIQNLRWYGQKIMFDVVFVS